MKNEFLNWTQLHKNTTPLEIINPTILKGDQHLISPDNLFIESNVKVKRIKEMIANKRDPGL